MAISEKSLYIPATFQKAYLRKVTPLLFIIATALLFVSCESGVDSDAPFILYSLDYDSILFKENSHVMIHDTTFLNFSGVKRVIIQYEWKSGDGSGLELWARNNADSLDIFRIQMNHDASKEFISINDTLDECFFRKITGKIMTRSYLLWNWKDTNSWAVVRQLKVYGE